MTTNPKKQRMVKAIEEEIAYLKKKEKNQLSHELQLIDAKFENGEFAKIIAQNKCAQYPRSSVILYTLSQECNDQTIEAIVNYVQSFLPEGHTALSRYYGHCGGPPKILVEM